ncbi:MAG: cell division protein ZipA C-terminal FtsZ-binding domain-containing protein [Rhodocyclales bacterium]|nr:cell division protein ZipA C-terminal FtsZ-binding domain-containing protein [Rhodocyclales bacterium]
MVISELQIALIGAGAAGVALVWGYNVWQDRQHRKTADRIFKGGQGDALLTGEEAATVAAPTAAGQGEPGEWQEPYFGDAADALPEAPGAAGAAEPVADLPSTPEESVSPLPADCADAVADCVLRLTAAEPLPAPAVQAMQKAWAAELSKPIHWLARDDTDGAWRQLDAHDTGRYREWAAALQLVDRRGPVSDGELARFFDGVQHVAQQTAATVELPSRGETVMRAAKLDEFCAAVDIQFVLHVVEAAGGVFAGTKLRGVAEAAGLVLEGDGVFRARDEAGGELFTVANLGAERFETETIKSLATHGLTLSLDVPRVTDGVAAFDRMLAIARQLAAALGGLLVDAQRAPLSDAMIDAIRAKTVELQQRMRDGGIAPGSTRALRLFS